MPRLLCHKVDFNICMAISDKISKVENVRKIQFVIKLLLLIQLRNYVSW